MVTELHAALHGAVEPMPPDTRDLMAAVAAGDRRLRRRRVLTVGVACLAVAVGIGATVLVAGGEEGEQPVPVDLRLDNARPLDPEVLARTRTVQDFSGGEDGDLSYDRFDALTDDGLVARSRYTYDGDVSEFGLLDPVTGQTDWLPRPPWDLGDPDPLLMGADQLVYLDQRHLRPRVLVFDRNARVWSLSPPLVAPRDEVGRFFGSFPVVGGDGRLYLADADGELRWWSVPLSGGQARPEPELTDGWVAWAGAVRATSRADGSISLEDGDRTVEVPGRPDGCGAPSEPVPAPRIAFAGSDLVARHSCADGGRLVVYDAEGDPTLSVTTGRAGLVGANERRVVLVDGRHTYVLDLAEEELLALDGGTVDVTAPGDVQGDLLLWAADGPFGDDDTYDALYRVVRLP